MRDLNSLVDHVYVISLPERTDRREKIASQLNKKHVSFTFFDGVKSDTGKRGCLLAHIGVFQDAIKNGYNRIAVCEDDLILREKLFTDLHEIILRAGEFDLLFFHHHRAKDIITEMGPVIRHLAPWCTQFYITTSPKMLLDYLLPRVSGINSIDYHFRNGPFNTKVTTDEYAFQIDDFSDIEGRVIERFSHKSKYDDLLLKVDKKTVQRLEVLICAYGDYPEITLESIKKIIMSADRRDDLRIIVGANACGELTRRTLRTMLDKGEIEVLVESTANRNKDPTMRVLLEHVESPYFVWFDDDTYPVKKGWDTKVREAIAKEDFDVSGFVHVTNRTTFAGYTEFLSKRPWFKGWEEFSKPGADPKLASHSIFPHGAFWVARTAFLRQFDYPDRDMVKKADDMLLGELCAQQGGVLKRLDMWDWIDLNKGPRRGTGERADDGWKGIDVSVPKFNGLTIYPTGGMCNRLRNVITAIVLCREVGVPLRILWENDSDQIASVELTDYWTLPEDVVYESIPCSKLMENHILQRDTGNLFLRIPREKLRGGYHNHWGFCCLEGEEVTDRRLVQGLKDDVLHYRDDSQLWKVKDTWSSYIGVHVRSYEFLFGEREQDQIQKQISAVITAMRREGELAQFFLASDSRQIKDAIMEAFPGRVRVRHEMTVDFYSRADKNDFAKGVLDLYLLGMCKKVLGTKGSSFSQMAGLMAGKMEWMEGGRSEKEWEG